MSDLDKRLNAYRDDLADCRLEGKVEATRFVMGEPMRVVAPFADVKRNPFDDAGLDAQALHGDTLLVFEDKDGWAWVQCEADGYVGYVRSETLDATASTPTHMVSAPRTFLYSKSDLKSPRLGYRSMGSVVAVTDEVTTRGTNYLILSDGSSVIAHHLTKIGDWFDDPVSVAETLLHTPYLWGGNTGFGLDCSGLLTLSNRLCGKTVLRDSDMQAESIGEVLDVDESLSNLERGDAVFWKGHVGIMADSKMLLHANGNTMNVALEPLKDAVQRIGYLYGQPTLVRRP